MRKTIIHTTECKKAVSLEETGLLLQMFVITLFRQTSKLRLKQKGAEQGERYNGNATSCKNI